MPETTLMTRNSSCRACKGTRMSRIFSFGPTPPANAFLKKEELEKPELFFPLDVYFCRACSLVQLMDIVSPELLFKDYVYVSSTSPAFVAHFQSFANDVFSRFNLSRGSLVVDIGSNDGIILQPFKVLGASVLGIDPAVKIAEEATINGVETLPYFFNPDLAKKLVSERGYAVVITGTNVFAHVNDLDELVGGVATLLAPNGSFIIEAPYLVDFLEKNLFDTVYHEHLSYFAVRPLVTLFSRMNMEIFDVEKVNSHGGSLREFVKHRGAEQEMRESVKQFMKGEEDLKLDSLAPYTAFAKRIEKNKKNLLTLLHELKLKGKRIAGYGASAKGNTLLNYFGITHEVLEYMVDDRSWKQVLYTPGTHIPVVAAQKLMEERPDYILILAWNFAEQIMNKLHEFRASGGKFIIPVPEPKIL